MNMKNDGNVNVKCVDSLCDKFFLSVNILTSNMKNHTNIILYYY